MRIVVAPNAFKGSLSALQAAEAIRDGVLAAAADADLVLVPIADGGDGTVDALVATTHGERRTLRVRGPLTHPVDADYGVIDNGKTAVIEMAKAAGLALVPPDRRDPRVTTTYGVGELLLHADWQQAEVDVACDVTNPLTGPSGASAVYGPQKGATPEMVAELDAALRHFAEIIRRDLGRDVEPLPGAGAAGGLGAGLVAFT